MKDSGICEVEFMFAFLIKPFHPDEINSGAKLMQPN